MHSQYLLLALSALTSAHFVLQDPASLGFDDEQETVGPCGSFDPTDRTQGVTPWPIAGGYVGVITTHLNVEWEYNAALISDVTKFVPLTLRLHQTGVGSFCEPQIPGIAAWVGKDAVLQVVQHGPDGILYQCAAITFVAGGPGAVPADCTNSTAIAANWIGGGSSGGGQSSSSSAQLPTSPPSQPPTGPTTAPTAKPAPISEGSTSSNPVPPPPASSGNAISQTNPSSSGSPTGGYATALPSGTTPGESYPVTIPTKGPNSSGNIVSKPSYPTGAPSSGIETTNKGNSSTSAPTTTPRPSNLPVGAASGSFNSGKGFLVFAGGFAAVLAWAL